MSTYRELINQVLIRLREDTIPTNWSGAINDSSTITDYQKVIGALVNDSKRDIESYHDWLVLRETVDVTTVSGTRNYNLSAGQDIKVLDVINQDQGTHLNQISQKHLNSLKYPTGNSGDPLFYSFNGVDSSNNLKVDLEPIPNNAHTISFDINKPQSELTLAATVMKAPTQPVILGAWARAIAERGEDGGTNTSVAAAEVSNALNQAIALDSGNTRYEMDWIVN
tara:strand:- start:4271 stop:4942 length:672 start_codon:yes stop_codon:yes gene_type:complete